MALARWLGQLAGLTTTLTAIAYVLIQLAFFNCWVISDSDNLPF